jgi:PASTA domain
MDEREDRARSLLEAAGQTITVEPVTVLHPRPRPVWPILSGAAAVMILVIGLAVALAGDDRSTPPIAPRSELQVPQTLWMTTAQARSTLQGLGLRVAIRGESALNDAAIECGLPTGRVQRSSPPPTSLVPPGAKVTLTVLGASQASGGAFCVGPQRFEQDALALLDFARFGEGGPEFAPSVDLWLDGELTRSLTAEEAADPAAWGDPSPLTRTLAALDNMMRANGKLVSPSVWTLIDRGDQYGCGPNDPPAALRGRRSTVVTIEPRVDGPLAQCHWVRVYRNESGQVDAVASADQPWPADEVPPVEDEIPPEPTAEQHAVAEAFLEFASGGPAPTFADQFQLLLGNVPVATVAAANAKQPATWSLPCTAYAERSCPIDALTYVTKQGAAIHGTTARERSACHTVSGELPPDLTTEQSLANSVSFGIAEPAQCADNWEVQLWLDHSGAIRTVNLILGSSP